MTSLVRKLRKQATDAADAAQYLRGSTKTCCTKYIEWQAADEIELWTAKAHALGDLCKELSEEIEKLRGALRDWGVYAPVPDKRSDDNGV